MSVITKVLIPTCHPFPSLSPPSHLVFPRFPHLNYFPIRLPTDYTLLLYLHSCGLEDKADDPQIIRSVKRQTPPESFYGLECGCRSLFQLLHNSGVPGSKVSPKLQRTRMRWMTTLPKTSPPRPDTHTHSPYNIHICGTAVPTRSRLEAPRDAADEAPLTSLCCAHGESERVSVSETVRQTAGQTARQSSLQ